MCYSSYSRSEMTVLCEVSRKCTLPSLQQKALCLCGKVGKPYVCIRCRTCLPKH